MGGVPDRGHPLAVHGGEARRGSRRHDVALRRRACLQPSEWVHVLVLRLRRTLPSVQACCLPALVRARFASPPLPRLRLLLPGCTDEGEADATAYRARYLSAISKAIYLHTFPEDKDKAKYAIK